MELSKQQLIPTNACGRMPTWPEPLVSRREVLRTSLALGFVSIAAPYVVRANEAYGFDPNGPMPTPDQFLGPYYPVQKPADGHDDMARLEGRAGQALGEIIYVQGQVLNLRGEVCPDVAIEIWQTNAAGRYTHPNDLNPAPLDPNFDGYATLKTDAEGRYRFRTVKPGAYPVVDDFWRPPHIHFQLTGKVNRLVTQMYFPDEPLNAKDPILQVAWANETLIAEMQPSTATEEAGTKIAKWDIVLIQG